MSRIFLIRHGEVEGNSGDRPTFAGWNDVALTSRGELQAAAVARRLEREALRTVYSSDLQRAHRTAEYIAAPHNLMVHTDAAWREVNYGAWSGLDEAQLIAGGGEHWRQRLADPEGVAAPDGESYADLWQRLEPAWNRVTAQNSNDERSVAIVAHNGTIRILLCRLLGMPLNFYRRIRISNCGLSCIEVNENQKAKPQIIVRFVNETSYLEDI